MTTMGRWISRAALGCLCFGVACGDAAPDDEPGDDTETRDDALADGAPTCDALRAKLCGVGDPNGDNVADVNACGDTATCQPIAYHLSGRMTCQGDAGSLIEVCLRKVWLDCNGQAGNGPDKAECEVCMFADCVLELPGSFEAELQGEAKLE